MAFLLFSTVNQGLNFFAYAQDGDDFVTSRSDVEFSSDDETTSQKLMEDERENSIAVYEHLVQKTRDIPLEKVSKKYLLFYRDVIIFYN